MSTTAHVCITIDGQPVTLAATSSLASALGKLGSRISVGGQRRAPFCGMGVCFECRVTVNGQAHQRACQILPEPGMEVWRER
ncbi:(2Fe-2S)-binding protein [Chitinimonas sp.]|uniref:(2Fe-2S)-binding protein n=1 Tax=Chitinimonas sp. TaxID=1934313 RepID=UPI0035B075AF